MFAETACARNHHESYRVSSAYLNLTMIKQGVFKSKNVKQHCTLCETYDFGRK